MTNFTIKSITRSNSTRAEVVLMRNGVIAFFSNEVTKISLLLAEANELLVGGVYSLEFKLVADSDKTPTDVTHEYTIGEVVKDGDNNPFWIIADEGEKIVADGRQLLKRNYPDLYCVIGDTYRNPTTDIELSYFRIPDFRTLGKTVL